MTIVNGQIVNLGTLAQALVVDTPAISELAVTARDGVIHIVSRRDVTIGNFTSNAAVSFEQTAGSLTMTGASSIGSLILNAGAGGFAQSGRSSISAEGDKALVDGQRAWLETKGIDCNLASGTAEARDCLKTALAERLKQSKAAVEQMGGFTFVRVENNAAQAVTAEAAAASGLADSAPPALTRELRYPRIDNVASDAVQKFNTIMARMGQPKFKVEDATAESAEYKITFASPDIVSVQFLTSEYNLGAAHPNNGLTSVTVMMKEGREIAQADVFKPGSGWETFLTRRSVKALTKQFQDWGAGPPAINDVRDTATKAHNWTITQDSLVVLFPPYSVGPFALGAQEVKIPWKDLQPYVNPNAPAPITQPKAS
jgi:hypothetical protein